MPHTVLYFLALFCLSTSSNWAKLNHMPVEVLGFYRLGIAATIIGIWLFIIKQKRIPMNKTTLWIVVSGVFFFLHLWTFKYAAKNTTISNGMIIFASNPVWASIGAVLFFKEKLAKRLYLAYALAFASVYLLVGSQFSLQGNRNWGDLSSLVSAMLYAVYMLTGKKARQHFDNTSYSFIQYSVCALCFALCIGYTGAPVTGYDSISWIAVAGLVMLPTFFGHLSMTYLVQHMNLSLMTCGKLAEPVMASIIAWYIFNEHLSPHAPYAFALTTFAVAVLFAPQLKSFISSQSSQASRK